jgi:hypothetical protein
LQGYTHRTMNHSINFVNPHTNTIARGTASRFSLASTTMGRTMSTIWCTTCSRRGARHKAYHLLSNSCILSQTLIGLTAVLLALLPVQCDSAPAVDPPYIRISPLRYGLLQY